MNQQNSRDKNIPVNEKKGRLSSSLFWTCFAMVINYGILFVLTPYIEENLGVEANGFVSLAKTVSGYAIVLTGALNSFAARFISVEYHKGNIEKAKEYYSSVFLADVALAIIVLILTAAPIYFLERILVIPEELVSSVKILFVLDFLNFLMISASTAFLSGAIIKERMDITGKIQTTAYLSEAVFLVIAFRYFTGSIVSVGIGLVISAFVVLVVNGIVMKKLVPELRVSFASFSMASVKQLVVNGIWTSANSLGNLLNTGLDLVITDTMLSAFELGQLSLVKTISTIFSVLYSVIAGPFQPALLKAYADEDKEELIRVFKKGILISGLISNIAFAGFFALGNVYYTLWTPSQDSSFLHKVTIISVLGGIMEGAVYPLYYTYTITLKNKIPCFVTIASGLLNVLGMFVLIRYTNLGIYGVVVTTAVLSWIVNFVFNPLYASHVLEVKKSTFYPVLLRHILSCIIMSAVFYGITLLYTPGSWITLALMAMVLCLVGAFLHFLIVGGSAFLKNIGITHK